MMLVVAVALSTATYAWFTSNANVKATSVTMRAETNSAASIGISWTDSAYGTSIDAVSPGSTTYYAPTAISSLTANTSISGITWSSATIKDVGGNPTFNSDVVTDSSTLAYTWNDGTGEGKGHTSFYIHNGSNANTLSAVTATVTITGDATDFIRVGFFKYDPTAEVFKLKGVITDAYTYTAATGTAVAETDYYNVNGEKMTVTVGTTDVSDYFTRVARAASTAALGTATAETAVSGCITNTSIGTSVNLGGLNTDGQTGDEMQIKVMVWMDGSALTDATASTEHKLATVALHFDATRGAYAADTFGA